MTERAEFTIGIRILTTHADPAEEASLTDVGRSGRMWGVEGVVVSRHDSHGLCFSVRHDDGSVAFYGSTEIEPVNTDCGAPR